MNYTEQDIIKIAEDLKKEFPDLQNKVVSAIFYSQEGGENYWIARGVFELFEEEEEFYYMISDETGKIIQTMNEHGVNPHLEEVIDDEEFNKEWDEYDENKDDDDDDDDDDWLF